jgi:hypothetical protein
VRGRYFMGRRVAVKEEEDITLCPLSSSRRAM